MTTTYAGMRVGGDPPLVPWPPLPPLGPEHMTARFGRISVAELGEDGEDGLIALDHWEPAAALSAFAELVRSVDQGEHLLVLPPQYAYAIRITPGEDDNWAIRWAARRVPGAFPVTVLSERRVVVDEPPPPVERTGLLW
jgi:hypothetical protein